MAVDIVPEQCRRILCHHSETAVRKKTRLDKRLEAVADSEDKSSPVEKLMYLFCNLLIVQHIGYELTASVRLISCRESSAQGKYMAL